MTDIISPTYSFINLSSVKLYPLGLAPFKVSALTGRFISLEICTNQLSFSASCQCVKLSARCEGTPEGEYKGATVEKGNEFKQT